MCTVTNQSWYDLRAWKDVKPQQPTKLPEQVNLSKGSDITRWYKVRQSGSRGLRSSLAWNLLKHSYRDSIDILRYWWAKANGQGMGFTSRQLLRVYQNGLRLVTVHTYSDFALLLHWDTKLPAPWPDILLSLNTELTSPCTILLKLSARAMARQISIFISHWFNSTWNRTPDVPHARRALYRFYHRARG